MKKRVLAVLPIAVLAAIVPIDTGIAAPLHAKPPAVTGIVHLVQSRQAYMNGYRGYKTQRPGYRKGQDGYWYPSQAFRVDPDYTGSIRMEPRLRSTCDYGFAPTNGSQYCNY